jgi:hypothetical protein
MRISCEKEESFETTVHPRIISFSAPSLPNKAEA